MIREFGRGIWKGQKEFGETIGSIVNTILLSVVYLIGVGLTSIVAKISKKHFLDLEREKVDSYWEELNLGKKKKEEYYRQF